MSTYEKPSPTEMLEHHGIIGMKWGVRRYQNEDGSLTPAGKVRYRDRVKDKLKEKITEDRNEGMHDVRMKTDPLYRQKHTNQPWNEKIKTPTQKDKFGTKSLTEQKQRSQPWDEKPRNGQAWDEKRAQKNAHEDYTKAHDKKKVSEMSDKELRDRLNRLDMESRYDKMNPSTVSKGKQTVNKILKAGTAVATTTTTAITIYNNYNKIAEILNKRKG